MGLPLVVLCKLNFIATTHRTVTPSLAALLCPFVLKLSFRSPPLRRVSTNVLYSLRLFLFRFNQIAFGADADPAPRGGSTRWERALRLLYGSLVRARRTPASDYDEESLQALTMLAL